MRKPEIKIVRSAENDRHWDSVVTFRGHGYLNRIFPTWEEALDYVGRVIRKKCRT